MAELKRLHERGELKGEDDVRTALRGTLLEKVEQESGEVDLSSTSRP